MTHATAAASHDFEHLSGADLERHLNTDHGVSKTDLLTKGSTAQISLHARLHTASVSASQRAEILAVLRRERADAVRLSTTNDDYKLGAIDAVNNVAIGLRHTLGMSREAVLIAVRTQEV